MDEHVRTATRRSLHAVAEQLLAGPQHRAHGTIRLRMTPGGFGQVTGPWRVEGTDLVGPDARVPLTGTIAEIARAAGVEPGAPTIYADHADLPADAAHARQPRRPRGNSEPARQRGRSQAIGVSSAAANETANRAHHTLTLRRAMRSTSAGIA